MNVTHQFVERINAHDVAGIISLMTADHTFIDSLGARFTRPAIEEGWRRYFGMVPDYWIRLDRELTEEDISVLIGAAGGTYVPDGGRMEPENRWEAPAIWVARIKGAKLSEWRVYSDNEPIRAKMRKLDRTTG